MNADDCTTWWRDHSGHFGPLVMDRMLLGEHDWASILKTGSMDLERGLEKTGMRTGHDLSVLEVGCGMGRITFALAKRFGLAVGLDVSPDLLDRANAANDCANVHFELADGRRIRPRHRNQWDAIFSYEVFQYVSLDTLRWYFVDAYRLLQPGGQLVFQVNVSPIRLKSRLASFIRWLMHLSGKPYWRDWPTAPGARRRPHTVASLRCILTNAGFRIDRVVDKNRRQTWFLATKPE